MRPGAEKHHVTRRRRFHVLEQENSKTDIPSRRYDLGKFSERRSSADGRSISDKKEGLVIST